MKQQELNVGEVARRTGLTVRTLHHYDELGLVSPSARSSGGHRLYTQPDLARLQAVTSLKQLGFSLAEISTLLEGRSDVLGPILELHLAATAEKVGTLQRLLHCLESLSAQVRRGEAPTLESLLEAIEETTMQTKFFTPEQVARLAARKPTPEHFAKSQAQWQLLAAQMRDALARGVEPADAALQPLAARWRGLVHDITEGDEGLRAGLEAYYRADPELAAQSLGPGITREVLEYAGQAVRALGSA
jgi:DNA-binding transcriptional MerR regulator